MQTASDIPPGDPQIEFRDVTKTFMIREGRTLREFANAIFKRQPWGDEFRALDNVSFTVAHGETVGTSNEAGAVMIAYGTANGITSARSNLITRNSDGLFFTPMEGDRFGFGLASGDFDFDSYDDLAIGAPGVRCPGGTVQAGAVIVMYGSASGIVNRNVDPLPGSDSTQIRPPCR